MRRRGPAIRLYSCARFSHTPERPTLAEPAAIAAPAPTAARSGRPASSRRREFLAAHDFLREGDGHLFVTGRAGTGKSTLLRCLARPASPTRWWSLAPTGLAAVNVGGQTIHSFFGFPPRLIRPDDIRRSRNGRVMRTPQVPGHRRGVDGALRPDVGHRPVAARQPRPPARAVRRRAPRHVRRPAPAPARRSTRPRWPSTWSRATAGRSSSASPALREGAGTALIELTQVFRQKRRGAARRAQPGARRRGRRGRPRRPQRARASHPHAGRGRALRHPDAHQRRRPPHQHGLPRRAARRRARIRRPA